MLKSDHTWHKNDTLLSGHDSLCFTVQLCGYTPMLSKIVRWSYGVGLLLAIEGRRYTELCPFRTSYAGFPTHPRDGSRSQVGNLEILETKRKGHTPLTRQRRYRFDGVHSEADFW